jgi:hypothetical protein
MRAFKWIRRVLLLVVLAVVASAGVLYLMACQVPAGYDPAELTLAQRKRAARQFASRAAELHNDVWSDTPLLWTATQQELNWYLASMDEIAAFRLGQRRGQADHELAKAGLSGPAVRLRPGLVTLMVTSSKYGKVISADLRLSMTEAEKLSARLEGVRIGRLAVPDASVREKLRKLKRAVTARQAGRHPAAGPADARSADAMVGVAAKILLAVDEAPVRIEHEMNNRSVRLSGVELADERLTLVFLSLPPDAAPGRGT